MYGSRGSANAYRDTAIDSSREMPPQRKLVMLLGALIERVSRAHALLLEGDIPGKAQTISSAFPLLEALSGSLDFEAGGALAERLASIYDTATLRLAEANAANDAAKLQRIIAMLRPIHEAFAALPVDTGTPPAAPQR